MITDLWIDNKSISDSNNIKLVLYKFATNY